MIFIKIKVKKHSRYWYKNALKEVNLSFMNYGFFNRMVKSEPNLLRKIMILSNTKKRLSEIFIQKLLKESKTYCLIELFEISYQLKSKINI
jgi:hypothetical protein